MEGNAAKCAKQTDFSVKETTTTTTTTHSQLKLKLQRKGPVAVMITQVIFVMVDSSIGYMTAPVRHAVICCSP